MENLNDEYIEIQYSSGKLGWIGDGFLPYSEEIIFDGDAKFRQLFEAIQVKGDREAWYEHVKRSGSRINSKLSLCWQRLSPAF